MYDILVYVFENCQQAELAYAAMYEAAGYEVVRRAGRRTVVRKQVAP